MQRQDFIKRLIAEFGDFIARLSALISKRQIAKAERELASAEESLGLPRGSELLDARSLAMLLGFGDRVVLAAGLLEQRAKLSEARDDAPAALEERRRALELLGHARPSELRAHSDELRARLQARLR